jgi:dTDP-4-dehydrorhamnose 3,5-epimerase
MADSRFEVISSPIEGVKIIQRKPFIDERGFFERVFCAAELDSVFQGGKLSQINHSFTKKSGTIRGMHLQSPPYSELKIVTCLRGEVFDVALDLRAGSKTFLRWHAERLTENNYKSLLIPKGVAHGFQTITNNCELIYFHSHPFVDFSEFGANPLDPLIGIKWPLGITEISTRDKSHQFLNTEFGGFHVM